MTEEGDFAESNDNGKAGRDTVYLCVTDSDIALSGRLALMSGGASAGLCRILHQMR